MRRVAREEPRRHEGADSAPGAENAPPTDVVSRDLLPLHLRRAYLSAVDWLASLLNSPELGEAWDDGSAIEGYSVGGVAAHAVQGVIWFEQTLSDPEPRGLREVTVMEFYGPNRVDGSSPREDPLASALQGAAEAFALSGAATVLEACTTSRDRLDVLLESAEASRAVPVLRVPGGQVALREYLRTRVLEVVVHGDDVVSSVGSTTLADPPPEAVAASLLVCLEMAEARVGGLDVLRSMTRVERAIPDALRVL